MLKTGGAEMEFKLKSFTDSSLSLVTNVTLQIPKLCPNCGVSNNPSINRAGVSGKVVFFKLFCTDCLNDHYTLNQIENKTGKILAYFPKNQPSDLPKLVCDFSPRFEKMYHDAELSEENNAIDLAGIGYRASLEILVKDYALANEIDTFENISKKNLNNAIGQYFKSEMDLQTSADVVRILGNDYAHWDQHEGYDIETLKSYLQIFIQIINTKLMLKNPPVSRKKS